MNSRNILTRLQTVLISQASRVGVLVLCSALPGGSARAQQVVETGPAISQVANADAINDVQENQSSMESSSQDTPTHTGLPNAPSVSKASVSTSSLTLADRFHIYGRTLLRPYSIVGPALGAGIGQWEDEPPEWGQGAKGYGRRIGSGMTRQFISETIRFGVAAADGEDPRYHRSQDSGIWPRARHAIVETFTSETADGSRIPAYSRFAGTYGAAFISNAWYPDSRATAGYALRRGSTALASSVGFHLFEEFIPRKYFKGLHLQN
jgi:hypothetical protein